MHHPNPQVLFFLLKRLILYKNIKLNILFLVSHSITQKHQCNDVMQCARIACMFLHQSTDTFQNCIEWKNVNILKIVTYCRILMCLGERKRMFLKRWIIIQKLVYQGFLFVAQTHISVIEISILCFKWTHIFWRLMMNCKALWSKCGTPLKI